jgi:hypothetical protein
LRCEIDIKKNGKSKVESKPNQQQISNHSTQSKFFRAKKNNFRNAFPAKQIKTTQSYSKKKKKKLRLQSEIITSIDQSINQSIN